MSSRDEQERPGEWLRLLYEQDSYQSLLDETGSLALAAYRLARARARVRPVPFELPTTVELRTAAEEISRRTGCRSALHPQELVAECEVEGMTVIGSERASAA